MSSLHRLTYEVFPKYESMGSPSLVTVLTAVPDGQGYPLEYLADLFIVADEYGFVEADVVDERLFAGDPAEAERLSDGSTRDALERAWESCFVGGDPDLAALLAGDDELLGAGWGPDGSPEVQVMTEMFFVALSEFEDEVCAVDPLAWAAYGLFTGMLGGRTHSIREIAKKLGISRSKAKRKLATAAGLLMPRIDGVLRDIWSSPGMRTSLIS